MSQPSVTEQVEQQPTDILPSATVKGTYRSKSGRIILALSCMVGAFYFYFIPNLLTTYVGDFHRGVLVATFIFCGLIILQPILEAERLRTKAKKLGSDKS